MSGDSRIDDLVHDIRNRLSVARANIEAFIDGKLVPSTDRLKSVLQTLDQLNALLDKVGPDRGLERLEPQPNEVDICEVLDREYLAAEAVATKKGVSFSVARCPVPTYECRHFVGDPVRIGQIVSNVLSNAIKFTPGGGSVLVDCSRRANQLEITVNDSGPGLQPGEADRIFARGIRGAASKGVAGSGYGLAIAKEFVEAHGGSIEASPDVPGGASFVVKLPGRIVSRSGGAASQCAQCAVHRPH